MELIIEQAGHCAFVLESPTADRSFVFESAPQSLEFIIELGSVTTGGAWESITNRPATFAPSAHNHALADVTNLQTALDGKAVVAHTHPLNLYIQQTQPTLTSGQPFVWYELDESGVIQDIHIFDGVI